MHLEQKNKFNKLLIEKGYASYLTSTKTKLWKKPFSKIYIKVNIITYDRIIQFDDGSLGHIESLSLNNIKPLDW